jgi:2-polyprenyl-3-methyl-5-hydroxy-6-metoxy-1,4-benzoquinol methylase
MAKLTEEAIRPSALMEKQKVVALTDVGRMLSKYGEFVSVPCPACGSDEAAEKFVKNGIKYVECESCETFYVNPRPTSEVLGWFYQGSPNYEYWNNVIFPASEEVRRERIFVPRVDRLLELSGKYKVQMNSLLEIGSGFGTFCAEVKSRNVFEKIVAVEPTPDLAETCRGRGIEVIEKPVEQIQLDSKDLFDVIANFEVIEHLFAPADFIRAAVGLLKPGGLLMLTCPNGKGFDVETLGVLSDTVDHEHLNYFNQKSLAKLLEKTGLEVLESFTPGVLDADLVRNKAMSGEFDVSNQPFLQKVLIDEWDQLGGPFQSFLVEQGLSSNMWVVARKPYA